MMVENLEVSNPSARLLKRMGVLLGESVAYLLGEEEQDDAIYKESKENWHAWIRETDGPDARTADEIFTNWKKGYFAHKAESSPISLRNELTPMQKADWDASYQAAKAARSCTGQRSMFK
jgi:hypothetical protein